MSFCAISGAKRTEIAKRCTDPVGIKDDQESSPFG